MRAALAQASMTLWREKHRKAAIFRRKMSGVSVLFRALGASGACPAPTAAEQRRGSAIASRDPWYHEVKF